MADRLGESWAQLLVAFMTRLKLTQADSSGSDLEPELALGLMPIGARACAVRDHNIAELALSLQRENTTCPP